jgi:hypothetical protein
MTSILAVNWEAISAIGQIVGALAVVISLIYVAREIRSNARAARFASMDNINRWLREVAEHPDLAELYYRGIHDFESLQNRDLVRFSMLMDQLFYIYQEMYYQQLEGHLDPRLWGMTELPMRDINAYPGVQAWWRSRSHWFSEDFAKHVNQLQQTAKAPRLFREPMKDE